MDFLIRGKKQNWRLITLSNIHNNEMLKILVEKNANLDPNAVKIFFEKLKHWRQF